MSENGSIEGNRVYNTSENAEEEIPEARVLSQKPVNQQVKSFIAPLTRQLEELTRPSQGMATTQHSSHYPRAQYSAISGAAVHPDDNMWSVFKFPDTRNSGVLKKLNS